jgi:hypothetical protein
MKIAALQQKSLRKVLALLQGGALVVFMKHSATVVDSFSKPMVSCNAPANHDFARC